MAIRFHPWIARLLAGFFLSLLGVQAASPPNIVFLLSDDQRADTIAELGNRSVKTPNLDKLARRGFSFRNAFCMGGTVGAICAPSRAMLLTGRSLFHAVDPAKDPGAYLPDYEMMPKVFRKAGYVTAGIGKWHNPRPAYQRCFSTGGPIFFGGMSDPWKIPVQLYDPAGAYGKERQHTGAKHATELFADAAVDFLKATQKDRPFFLYVAFTSPHDPRIAPPEFTKLYKRGSIPLPRNYLPEHPFDNGEMKIRDEALLPWPRTREAIEQTLADYYACISHLDSQVGRILQTLRDLKLEQNTIVVYTSDHGLAVGSHGLLGKQNMYDHSMRSPLLVAGPGVPRGGRSDALCYLYDIFPTLADLAGVAAPATVEGNSLAQIIRGKQTSVRDGLFCAYRHVQRMYRTRDWKIIHYPLIGRYQLFHVSSDPDELTDLSTDPASQRQLESLKAKLAAARSAASDPNL